MLGGMMSKVLASKKATFGCNDCGETGCITLEVEISWFHAMFIPAFVADKDVYSTCGCCGKKYVFSHMPESYKNEAKQLKKAVKAPFWYYSLTIGVLVILPLSIIIAMPSQEEIMQNKIREQSYIDRPAVNDIYLYKQENNWYTLLKVTEVFGNDSLYFVANDYEAEWSSTMDQYNTPANFMQNEEYIITNEEVKKLYKERTIVSVTREIKEE